MGRELDLAGPTAAGGASLAFVEDRHFRAFYHHSDRPSALITPGDCRVSPLFFMDDVAGLRRVERSDGELIEAVLNGDVDSFEPLVARYQGRVFGTARRYSRRDGDVQDLVQEIFVKAFQKLGSFRGEAPFEHWLMRLAVRTCYDHLRSWQRKRENPFSDLTDSETEWLEGFAENPLEVNEHADAAKELVRKLLDSLSPPARMVIQLLEIEGKSVKEISAITGWSVSLVKVRAFRARAEMRKVLGRLARDKYF